MLIDAHQHFWVYNHTEYPWISDKMEVLKRDFLPGDLLPMLRQLNIDGTVAVQARQSLEETRWLLELSGKNDFIKGVVGWVDLCSPGVEDQLQELTSISKFKGVRHVLHDEPDKQYMLRDGFVNGISLLRKYNLVYDLLVFPDHLATATTLVKKFPDQQFILDHIAKPPIKEKILYPWDHLIRDLASQPNVACKLSGIVTEASWSGWNIKDFTPYLDVIFDSFGTSRLLMGSDWPVCTVASSYEGTMKIVADYIAAMDNNERELILGRNAERIYNL